MKPSKMLELVENLKVGEKVVIEKFEDHLFIEKKLGNRIPSEWIPAPSDNVNIHDVDLSILNDKDWFYVEAGKSSTSWIAQSNILEVNKDHPKHYSIEGDIMFNDGFLCFKNEITLLRKATPEDLEPFFEKYPMYAPVKVGDIGLFYDTSQHIKDNRCTIAVLAEIRKGQNYEYEEKYAAWKYFFKISEHETIKEIKERFLKEN